MGGEISSFVPRLKWAQRGREGTSLQVQGIKGREGYTQHTHARGAFLCRSPNKAPVLLYPHKTLPIVTGAVWKCYVKCPATVEKACAAVLSLHEYV